MKDGVLSLHFLDVDPVSITTMEQMFELIVLFPGRLQNAAALAQYAESLQAGEHPRAIWERARRLAGCVITGALEK